MTTNGTVVIDEIVLDIDRIFLRDGIVWVYAARCPVTATVGVNSDISVFAPDGSLVFHAPTSTTSFETKQAINGRLTVELPLKLHFDSRP